MSDQDEMFSLLSEINAKTAEPELSIPEKVMGYSRSYLSGPTFGLADNIEAGVASIFTPLSYDQELHGIRQEQDRFKRNTDYLDNAVEIGSGAILNPLGMLGKTAQGAKSGYTTAVRALTNPVTQGAIAGIGNAGEGEDLVKSGLYGALFGAGGSALASGTSSLSQRVAKEADRLKLSSFSVNFGAVQNQLKKLGDGVEQLDEIPFLKTIDKFEKQGVISAGDDALENFGRVLSHQEQLGETLTAVLAKADKVLPSSNQIGIKNTTNYIKSLSGTARDKAELAAVEELTAIERQIGKGTLADLQKAKIGLNYKWDQNPYSEGVIKSMRSDLRQEIENRVNLAASTKLIDPKLQGSVKLLNSDWGEAAELKDVFTKQLAKDYGGDFVEDAFNSIRTSGGVGVLINASATTKNPLAMALGVLGTAARSNENKGKIADTLRELKVPFSKFGDFLEGDKFSAGVSKLTGQGTTIPAPITSRTTNQILEAFSNTPDAKPDKANRESSPEQLKTIESLLNEINRKTGDAPSAGAKQPVTFEPGSLFTPKGQRMDEPTKKDVKLVEAEIAKDPYFDTLYQFESNRKPEAANKESSAKGGFQFINSTAKAMGLDDPFDLGKSYEAVKKLDEQSSDLHENDPLLRYSAHYLGETVLRKVLNGEPLTDKQEKQVAYLREVLYPRFKTMYQANLKKITGKTFEI